MNTGDVVISHAAQEKFLCLHKIWVGDRYYGWCNDLEIYDFLLSRGLDIPCHFKEQKEENTLFMTWIRKSPTFFYSKEDSSI